MPHVEDKLEASIANGGTQCGAMSRTLAVHPLPLLTLPPDERTDRGTGLFFRSNTALSTGLSKLLCPRALLHRLCGRVRCRSVLRLAPLGVLGRALPQRTLAHLGHVLDRELDAQQPAELRLGGLGALLLEVLQRPCDCLLYTSDAADE